MEDRHGSKGYVPITYLKNYQPATGSADTSEKGSNSHNSGSQLEKVKEEESWIYAINGIFLVMIENLNSFFISLFVFNVVAYTLSFKTPTSSKWTLTHKI